MKKSLSLFLLCCITITAGYSQNIRSEEVQYYFYRLPLTPLDKSVKNYQVAINAAYEEKNRQLIEEYEKKKAEAAAEYKDYLAKYPLLKKTAEEKYAKELAEYNKKSLGTKIIETQLLEQNNKPVKQLPPIPYLRTVSPPVLQASYDYKILENTYLNLDGYQKSADNALNIQVIIYGYDYTQPRRLTEQKNIIRTGTAMPTSTTKADSYYYEFSYRHPMALKISTPAGKEILSYTPPELNLYKTYKTTPTEKIVAVNTEQLIRVSEENILQENLKFMNNLINDRFGFSNVKRTAALYYVKSNSDYADLTTAFNEASSGLTILQQDKSAATAKLERALDIWNTALKESDLNNKKARIDKEVSKAIYLNILEVYFALGKAEEGKAIIDKLNTMNLSYTDRKAKTDFELLFTDLKNRKLKNY